MTELTIRKEEQVVFALRSLYEMFGYRPYKMTKFEEYDLYVRYKDFLISENVITFNDTNGRLMALKPDVTLSIIKNKTDEGSLKKVYYNENVYRVSKGTNSFKEIMQVGLECIGDVDSYCLCEVLNLACKSLTYISDRSVLSVSNFDIILNLLESENIEADVRSRILDLISKKSVHDLIAICKENDVSEKTAGLINAIASLYGKPEFVFEKLDELLPGDENVESFRKIINSLDDEAQKLVEIDFSTVGDSRYYNGIAFKGFVDGISGSVLSGGQYDKLMNRMKQNDKAVGFAIYLDMLERLNETVNEYDVDVVMLYERDCNIKKLNREIEKITYNGTKVMALTSIPNEIKYRKLMKFDGEEAKEV